MNKRRLIDAFAVYIAAVAVMFAVTFGLGEKLGLWSTAVYEILMALCAFLAVKIRGEDMKERFSLTVVPFRKVFGAVLLSVGGSFVSSAVLSVTQAFFPKAASVDYDTWGASIARSGPLAALLAMVVLPAVCEELLMRGYIQSAFGRKRPVLTVAAVGILFGIMHFDPYKLLPMAVLGAVFAFITYATGSVFPAVMCHLINNARALLSFTPGSQSESTYDIILKKPSLFAVAAFLTALGFIFGYLGVKIITGRRLKKPRGLLLTLLSLAVMIGSAAAVARTECSLYTESVQLSGKYEYVISTDCDRIYAVSVSAYSGGAPVSVTVTDENGGTVVKGTDGSLSFTDVLKKGSYTLTARVSGDGSGPEISVIVFAGPQVRPVAAAE